jgi:hypothetical protein
VRPIFSRCWNFSWQICLADFSAEVIGWRMKRDDLFKKLIEKGVIKRLGSRQSWAMPTDLFSRWLVDRGMSFREFDDALRLPSNGLDSARDKESGTDPKAGKKIRGRSSPAGSSGLGEPNSKRAPSTSTLKGFRIGKGLSRAMLAPILEKMAEFDRDLGRLIDLSARAEVNSLQEDVIERFKGYWNECHYTTQGDDARITKGLLCIISTSEVYYTIYDPTNLNGDCIQYKGRIELEIDSIMILVTSLGDGFHETMMFRYPYSYLTRIVPTEMTGVGAGINFNRLPRAAVSVVKRNVNLGKLTPKRLPRDAVGIFDDETALRILQSSERSAPFFEYGPRRTVFHRDWNQQIIERDIRNLDEKETVDIITTYIPDYFGMMNFFHDLACDKPNLRRFRCIFVDPLSSIFKLRFAFTNHDAGSVIRQVDKLRAYSMVEGSGVSFEVKFTPFWPMGFTIRVGRTVLYHSTIFATARSIKGPLIECRDPQSQLAMLFNDDFNTLWEHSSPDPIGDDLAMELGVDLAKKKE